MNKQQQGTNTAVAKTDVAVATIIGIGLIFAGLVVLMDKGRSRACEITT